MYVHKKEREREKEGCGCVCAHTHTYMKERNECLRQIGECQDLTEVVLDISGADLSRSLL